MPSGADVRKGLTFSVPPVNAHIIPIRRCNLSCAYCNEYDDRLEAGACRQMSCAASISSRDWAPASSRSAAASRCCIRTSTTIIARIRRRGMIATLITNGYLLTPRSHRRLNRAGLDHLQISIDNVGAGRGLEEEPEGAGPEARSGWPSDAEFDVTINSVVGGGIREPG